jgi:hypothetical protein
MPSPYYTFSTPLPPAAPDAPPAAAQFVVIDTESLTGGANAAPAAPSRHRSRHRASARRLAQSSSDAPAGWVPPAVDEVQWAWLAATLAASTAQWLIVVGHHPVWSVGAYGPTWPLVTRLAPMLQAAGVAVYVSAHEYDMQHIVTTSEGLAAAGGGVDYVVAGNGAYAVSGTNASAAHAGAVAAGGAAALQFAYAGGTGFTAFAVAAGSRGAAPALTCTFYDAAGTALYSFSKGSPRGLGPAAAGADDGIAAAAAAQRRGGAVAGVGARAGDALAPHARALSHKLALAVAFAALLCLLWAGLWGARARRADAAAARALLAARRAPGDGMKMTAWPSASEATPLVAVSRVQRFTGAPPPPPKAKGRWS